MANAPKVPEMFVNNHVFMQFANVGAAQLVNVSAPNLADCVTSHVMYIAAPDEANSASALIVEIMSHGRWLFSVVLHQGSNSRRRQSTKATPPNTKKRNCHRLDDALALASSFIRESRAALSIGERTAVIRAWLYRRPYSVRLIARQPNQKLIPHPINDSASATNFHSRAKPATFSTAYPIQAPAAVSRK